MTLLFYWPPCGWEFLISFDRRSGLRTEACCAHSVPQAGAWGGFLAPGARSRAEESPYVPTIRKGRSTLSGE